MNIGIARNLARRHPGCGTSAKFVVSATSPGAGAFSAGLVGVPPGGVAALGLSTGEGFLGYMSCAVWLNLSSGALLSPVNGVGVVPTTTNGTATLTFSIPNAPSLVNSSYYAQWVFSDSLGPFTFGGITYSTSMSRKIVIW